MNELHKERNREWLKDLRSEQFKQVVGRLGEPSEGMCCLGVACETRARILGIRNVNSPSVGSPSPAVAKFFGWSRQDPEIVSCSALSEERTLRPGDNLDVPASSANDDYRLTFFQIADKIEEAFGL